MPYLIITDTQHELDRHDLRGPVVIGRSPECDVVVRDVLLSRRHLRVEPLGERWVITDLGSKNGTFIDNERVEKHMLGDADVVKAGRTRIIFKSGPFAPPPPEVLQRKASRRPADPIEALSGTVMGFELTDMEENSRATGFPIPRPRPVEPAGYKRENVDGMVTQMATSSGQYDLALRESPPPPGAAVATVTPAREVRAREADIRAARANAVGSNGARAEQAERAAPPPARAAEPTTAASLPRWLMLVYILIAYVLCALVLWLLSWE
jgi:pSer/pThr/pTyr-binding forkhead associated (FHA) protein